jgi:hypothetical protein
MNNEIKQEWISALRSGEYKQAKHVLNGDGGMCCLGVLCDLYMKKTGEGEWVPRTAKEEDSRVLQKYTSIGTFEGSEVVPPASVMKWADLDKENPNTGIYQGFTKSFEDTPGYLGYSLAELNDGGLTFNQIADVIQFTL